MAKFKITYLPDPSTPDKSERRVFCDGHSTLMTIYKIPGSDGWTVTNQQVRNGPFDSLAEAKRVAKAQLYFENSCRAGGYTASHYPNLPPKSA